MNAESNSHSSGEIVEEISKWTVGGGIITTVLFPLALPILALTAVAFLPLLIPVLAAGLLAGIVALPIRLVRRRSRRRPPEIRVRPMAASQARPAP